jgi:hypothetical protein
MCVFLMLRWVIRAPACVVMFTASSNLMGVMYHVNPEISRADKNLDCCQPLSEVL